jgi:hypothetical protein
MVGAPARGQIIFGIANYYHSYSNQNGDPNLLAPFAQLNSTYFFESSRSDFLFQNSSFAKSYYTVN